MSQNSHSCTPSYVNREIKSKTPCPLPSQFQWSLEKLLVSGTNKKRTNGQHFPPIPTVTLLHRKLRSQTPSTPTTGVTPSKVSNPVKRWTEHEWETLSFYVRVLRLRVGRNSHINHHKGPLLRKMGFPKKERKQRSFYQEF